MSEPINELLLHAADDMHVHLRDGDLLLSTVPAVAAQFSRAVIMPNLKPPVTTAADAIAYKQRIMAALPAAAAATFTPLMTLYLTDSTTPEDVAAAAACGIVVAYKLYPAGATTHSTAGVTDMHALYPTFRAMAQHQLLLLIHGESTDQSVDIFDREASFMNNNMPLLVAAVPQLRIVMEHITTADAVNFVLSASANVAATITCQHLLYNRNALFLGGLNPHYYCLPVLKAEAHRAAVLAAATSGNPKFFAGTDSAPHSKQQKEASCCAAGCYTVFAALELYAEAFESANALSRLDDFVSRFGAEHYRLKRNDSENATTVLKRQPWTVPQTLLLGSSGDVVPLKAGQQLQWRKQ